MLGFLSIVRLGKLWPGIGLLFDSARNIKCRKIWAAAWRFLPTGGDWREGVQPYN